MSNIIIFGGTFDPIHNGHLRIALDASLKLNADVIFVPSKSPRWKTPLTAVEHHVKMLKIAMKNAPAGSQISDYELKSDSPINYSIDTVRYFRKKYPKAKLYFLIGADQVNRFAEWKNAEELSRLATVTFVARPKHNLDKLVIQTYNMLDLSFMESGDVSSTDFREMRTLDIPTDVLKYIEQNRLYFVGKIANYITEKRLEHSIQVANLAYSIARFNKLDHPEKYYFTGLLHDIGKTPNMSGDEAEEFMKKHFPKYVNLPKFSYHQFIGAYIAEHDFGIKDKDILNAICFHCTGVDNMSPLGMVVYAADKIEPTRQFDSRWLINSCLRDWKQGFLDTLTDNKKYLLAHNKDISNELTDRCFKMYLEGNK